MDEEKLIKIRNYITYRIIREPGIMFSRDTMLEEFELSGYKPMEEDEPDLIEVIVGLFEYLHKEVTGEDYDYFYHWANKIGAWVETDVLNDFIDKHTNEEFMEDN